VYILHYRRKRARSLLVVGVLLVALGVGAYMSRDLLDTETVIGPTPAAVYSTVSDNRPKPKQFDEKLYSFSLPGDWEKFALQDALPNSLSWRNTKGNKGVRVITIYTDATLRDMAVNRALPVQVSGERFMLEGDVSDNCVNFTTRQANGPEKIAAKWQGTDFICDTANRFRNVVGISAAGAAQGVALTGAAAGKHVIYITYTDSSANFSAYDFNEMIKSFRLK
jgi:hypothetical protein